MHHEVATEIENGHSGMSPRQASASEAPDGSRGLGPAAMGYRPPGLHQLCRVQTVPVELSSVFGFFANPSNLESITPPRLRFQILNMPEAGMGRGARIDYRLSLRGVPFRWKTVISAWEPGVLFADEALQSPFRSWFHLHEFDAVEDGTRIRDTVWYRLPFGPLGRLAHRWVAKELDAIFDFREQTISTFFELPIPPAVEGDSK
jgi:ligand-binding SRPBCC domain-containing protein